MQDQLSKVRAKDDFDIEGPLPSKNVDTGMGLERMASILQGVDNLYEIDTTWKILDRAAELTEQTYGRDHRTDVALRVIADHVRSAVMLIEDGVLPATRAAATCCAASAPQHQEPAPAGRAPARRRRRQASGSERSCTSSPRPRSTRWRELYPELRRDAANIHTVIDAEETAFASTLRTGTAIFDAAVEENRRRTPAHAVRRPGLPAARHLRLPDRPDPGDGGRAGPVRGRGRVPPADGRAAGPGEAGRGEKKTGNADISAFAEMLERSGRSPSPATTRSPARRPSSACWSTACRYRGGRGHGVDVVLDRTPFYAEGGGQLADARRSRSRWRAARSTVSDVQTPLPGLVVHRGKVRSARSPPARPRTRRSTSSAAARSPGRTPRPTWCTARCAARWGSRRRRRARRTRPAGSGSTSPPPARCRCRCCGTPRTRSTRCWSTT
jgi:alanyl-tRNA synthetase